MASRVRAGRITGSPTTGLCERICIEVQRVFDGCRESRASQPYTLVLTEVPPLAVPPFTYMQSLSAGSATFEDISVLPTSSDRYRVAGNIRIPVTTAFTDAEGRAFAASATVTVHRDFLLRLPAPSIEPYTFGVTAGFRSDSGHFLNENTVAITGCYTIVAKVLVRTDVLVPTYGYCVYPMCDGGACSELLSLPLFP